MHKEGLETYNELIKIFILLLCTSIRQDKEILLDYNYMYVTMQSKQPARPIKLLFLTTVLTNQVILIILFLQ